MESVLFLMVMGAILAAATRDSSRLNFYQRRIRQAASDRDRDLYPPSRRCRRTSRRS